MFGLRVTLSCSCTLKKFSSTNDIKHRKCWLQPSTVCDFTLMQDVSKNLHTETWSQNASVQRKQPLLPCTTKMQQECCSFTQKQCRVKSVWMTAFKNRASWCSFNGHERMLLSIKLNILPMPPYMIILSVHSLSTEMLSPHNHPQRLSQLNLCVVE